MRLKLGFSKKNKQNTNDGFEPAGNEKLAGNMAFVGSRKSTAIAHVIVSGWPLPASSAFMA